MSPRAICGKVLAYMHHVRGVCLLKKVCSRPIIINDPWLALCECRLYFSVGPYMSVSNIICPSHPRQTSNNKKIAATLQRSLLHNSLAINHSVCLVYVPASRRERAVDGADELRIHTARPFTIRAAAFRHEESYVWAMLYRLYEYMYIYNNFTRWTRRANGMLLWCARLDHM